MSVNISELTDKELRALLRQHGQTPGPVTGTTRRVYEIKLASLLSGAEKEEKKRRRATFDTLRRTEKPKVEPRRKSEKVPVPQVPSSLNLSDYSDAELPELSLTPEPEAPVPDPPQSLVFSRSPRPTRRPSTKKNSAHNSSIFSDTDDPITQPKGPTLPTRPGGKPTKSNTLPILVGAMVVLLGAVVTGYLLLTPPSAKEPQIAPSCRNIPFSHISITDCDRLHTELWAEKKALDVLTGEVECGKKVGDLHQPSPLDPDKRTLLFYWREDLNYTIYIKRENLFIELETTAELADFNAQSTAFFYSTRTPHISWVCFVSKAVSSCAFYILTVAALAVMAQLAHKVYQWKRSKAKQETGQMYELIDQIIEELQRNYSKYQTDPMNYVPYVAIPHARDRLLLPSERAAMKHIWERAVQFIAQHESRVRVEMRRVQSEDFPVWYWLEASRTPAVPADSTSPDFLYPDLDDPLTGGKEPTAVSTGS